MLMNEPQPLRPENLDAKNLQRLQAQYPGIRLPVLAELYSQPPTTGKPRKARKRVRRPLHVYILISLVGIVGYILLGIGWIVGVIGDSLYEVGKRMHEAKWRIT